MPDFTSNAILAGIVSIAASAFLTVGVRSSARKFGFISNPTSDRRHTWRTAILGGVAIFARTFAMYGVFGTYTVEFFVIFAAAAFLFFVGLLDDILNIKPYQKLIGQVIGAAFVVGFGLKLPLTG